MPLDAPERAKAAITHNLRRAITNGHCCVPQSKLLEAAGELVAQQMVTASGGASKAPVVWIVSQYVDLRGFGRSARGEARGLPLGYLGLGSRRDISSAPGARLRSR